jgi:SAM-dependent methyltransferase
MNEHSGHHHHGHGHHHDRGVKAMLRYLRHAPGMWRSEVNDAVVDRLRPSRGEHAVDLGAGLGPACVRAARAGASVTAVEPTPYMRAILRLRARASRAGSRITVADGAAEAIPVPDATADVLWATNSMHHWTDTGRAVTEIRRVLRPGGRVLLVDERFGDPEHPDHERFARRGSLEDHGFHEADASEMGRLLTEAGFVDVDTSTDRLAGRPVVAVEVVAPR